MMAAAHVGSQERFSIPHSMELALWHEGNKMETIQWKEASKIWSKHGQEGKIQHKVSGTIAQLLADYEHLSVMMSQRKRAGA